MAKEKKKPEKAVEASEKEDISGAANEDEKVSSENDCGKENAAPVKTAEKEDVPDESVKKMSELEKKLSEANEALLRTAAEYDNFRKRTVREKDAIYSDSRVEIVKKLLPVIDNFERASAAESELEDYKKGIEMTVKQLLNVFSSLGVEAFGAPGEKFDPNFHNGVMHIEDESLEENVIAEVFMKGYKLGDKVIRFAAVKVAN